VNHAISVLQGLAESEMCLPYTVDKLESAIDEVRESHRKLEDAQEQILHNEKMAAMGQLAAGVAHEVNNPLGTVLLYSHMLKEAISDNSKGNKDDLDVIIRETERCQNIVSGLLNFSRQSRLNLSEYNINTCYMI
jgi:phosphoglycerate-specific signal transduction histidine kinase